MSLYSLLRLLAIQSTMIATKSKFYSRDINQYWSTRIQSAHERDSKNQLLCNMRQFVCHRSIYLFTYSGGQHYSVVFSQINGRKLKMSEKENSNKAHTYTHYSPRNLTIHIKISTSIIFVTKIFTFTSQTLITLDSSENDRRTIDRIQTNSYACQ